MVRSTLTQNYDCQHLGQALSVEACWLVNLWMVSPALKMLVRSAGYLPGEMTKVKSKMSPLPLVWRVVICI